MEMAYKITEVCGDWALHIPPYGKTDAEMILIFNSRNNAELVKSVLEWEDAHPNKAVPYKPTFIPPNEPLTLEQLRQMDGEPVFVVIDDGIEPLKMWALVDYIAEEQCLTLTNNLGGRSQYYTADDLEIYHITAYRRPPEGETDA